MFNPFDVNNNGELDAFDMVIMEEITNDGKNPRGIFGTDESDEDYDDLDYDDEDFGENFDEYDDI